MKRERIKGENSIEKLLQENPEPGFGELIRLTEEGPQIFYPQTTYQKTEEGKKEATKERKTNRGFLFLVGSISLTVGIAAGYTAKTYEGKLLERIERVLRPFAFYSSAEIYSSAEKIENGANFDLPLVPIKREDQK